MVVMTITVIRVGGMLQTGGVLTPLDSMIGNVYGVCEALFGVALDGW